MTPVSIRNRTPEQSAAISRTLKAAKMRALFDDVEAQLTDPTLLEMTRFMRDTVMGSPEFAEPPFEVTCDRQALERFRAHPDVVAAKQKLTPGAVGLLIELQEAFKHRPGDVVYKPTHGRFYAGKELVDAGLAKRTIHADGLGYVLTDAGREWRAS